MGNSPFGLEPWKSLHHVDLAQAAPREYELLHTSLTIRYSTLLGGFQEPRFVLSADTATSARRLR